MQFELILISSRLKIEGVNGCGGKGGMGGNSVDADDVEVEYMHILYFLEFSTNVIESHSKAATKSGHKGDDGANFRYIENPAQPNQLIYKDIVKNYVDYMASKMANNVQKSVLSEFMNELTKDAMISATETVKQFRLNSLLSRRNEDNGHVRKQETCMDSVPLY